MDLTTQVRELVVDQLNVDPATVTLTAKFAEDLGADSLDRIDLTMRVEDEFQIEIPEREADTIVTFGQLVNVVTTKVSKKKGSAA